MQKLFNLSDEELEYQVNDRLSFTKFLHLGLKDIIPDATTIWLFREQLTKQGLIEGLIEGLFNRFDDHLRARGYKAEEGQIVDAILVSVPQQRNS